MGAVVDDVRRLVAKNYCEIVLTGVDITSYGSDLPGAPKLGALVKQILKHVRTSSGCACRRSIRSRLIAICWMLSRTTIG